MLPISFKRHRFPPDAIRHAVWLYFRFTLSTRYVKELMLQRGVEVGREVIRCQVKKFSSLIASDLRRRRDPQNKVVSRRDGGEHRRAPHVSLAGRRR